MERNVIRDSRLWLPVFRYAPYGLRAGVGMKDEMTNEQTTEPGQRTRSPFRAIRAIDYTVIFVRDMAAMRRFYEDVLAFPLLRELSPNWIEYGLGPNTLALARPGRTATDAPTPAGQCRAATGLQGIRGRSRCVCRRTRTPRRGAAVTADEPVVRASDAVLPRPRR
ncbi:hypothetical protein ACVWXM_007436 [Bradyrhizobium sp. GM7.3]